MIRRLFTAASTISLLLCVATVSLWIFTYYRGIGWRVVRDFHPDAGLVQVRCAGMAFRGGFCVNVTHNHATTVQSTNDLLEDHRWSPAFKVWTDSADELDAMNDHLLPRRTYRFKSASPSPFGFQFGTRQGVYQGNEFWTATAAIPFWFPFTLLAVLLLLWAWDRQRRHRRARRGYCRTCGYDLRASIGCCPECGTPIPAEAKA